MWNLIKRWPRLVITILALGAGYGLFFSTDYLIWKSGYGGTPEHAPAQVSYFNPPKLDQQSFGSPQSLRLLAIGDWGYESYIFRDMARGLQKYTKEMRAANQRLDAILLTGDNFYPKGIDSLEDERWKTYFKDKFDPTELDCYVTLGNHDYKQGLKFGQLQVTQSGRPGYERWICRDVNGPDKPGVYFTQWLEAADLAVQIVVVDTNTLVGKFPELHAAARKHLHWVDAQLKLPPPKPAKAIFRIVLGHHPVACYGEKYYDVQGINGAIAALGPKGKTLKDMMLESADMYVCGHAHTIQFIDMPGASVRKEIGQVHGLVQQRDKPLKMQLVSGTGSKVRRSAFWGDACYYSARLPGFVSITLDPTDLQVTVAFHDTRGGNSKPIYALRFPMADKKSPERQ